MGLIFGGKAGFFILGGFGSSLEGKIVFGGTKHFFVAGIEYYLREKEEHDWITSQVVKFINDTGIYPLVAYRFQARRGFLLETKLSVVPLDGPIPVPSVSLGYSF